MSIDKHEREELVTAIHEGAGLGGGLNYDEMAKRFYEASWGAICHSTGRCGRGYLADDTSPEATIYRLMLKAFQG